MDQLIRDTAQTGDSFDSSALILSSIGTALANVPPDAELATVRQMMETLFSRVEALQQNQAIQLAGVHDRLDAVELELPLMQEQSALRMRDMEARVCVEIDQAARTAVEEATAAAAAVVQEEMAGKFSSLAAQMEAQRSELRQLRESKMAADARLNRAVQDIERLCGNLDSEEEPLRVPVETTSSPYRSRINAHIRQVAVELATAERSPVRAGVPFRNGEMNSRAATPPAPIVRPAAVAPASDPPKPLEKPAEKPTPVSKPVPGFDEWKRQFMQDGEPLQPALSMDDGKNDEIVICPRCFSDRTRPASLNRLDYFLRLGRLTPHRCRACSHRFYKRVAALTPMQAGKSGSPA